VRIPAACIAVALAALSLAALFAAEDTQQEGVEAQARGPVHEAFAEASDSVASPGVVVTKPPPEPVEETPPEEKPEGDNVVWIPGYWAWDEDAEDFLWISGFWRAVPPGRTWVPGDWQKVKGGYQWVAGYWADAKEADESEYLPEPPESLERGPSTPAPAEDYAYVPGVWLYQVTKFAWRPGFWVRHRPNWVWTPDCYKWTPAGHVFVHGFWDAPLAERGLLFAPVRFTRAALRQREFVYRPSYVVEPDFLISSLFVRSGTRRYHFGDYFDARLRKRYVPWFEHRIGRTAYDANYAYYRHAYAGHAGWEKGVKGLYAARYSGDVPRPPVTYAQQTKVINKIRTDRTGDVPVSKTVNITHVQNVTALAPLRKAETVRATGLARLAGLRDGEKSAPVAKTYRIEKVRESVVKEERKHVERYKVVAQHRKAAETKAAAKLSDGKLKEPAKVRIELPKTTPPPRAIKSPAPPPPPVRKAEDKSKDRDKGKSPPPVKDRDKAPPPAKDKDKAPPRDKDKGKEGPPPRDKDRPPAKEKDKGKSPPPPPPPNDKDKEKDKGKAPPPPPPPKDKEKEKGKAPPPPPPPPKDKDKGKAPPPPPPPPKDKDKEKDKGKAPPPPPPKKEKDKDKEKSLS